MLKKPLTDESMWVQELCKALDISDLHVKRILIDIQPGKLVEVTITQDIDEEAMDKIDPAELANAKIIRQG